MPFRNRSNGRFTSKAAWARAKARGSKRIVRERKPRKRRGRYANVLFETGYKSKTPDNGYSFLVLIQRKLRETYLELWSRVTYLIEKGYFDEWAEDFDVSDFGWATFHNYYKTHKVTPGSSRKRAVLVNFERI